MCCKQCVPIVLTLVLLLPLVFILPLCCDNEKKKLKKRMPDAGEWQ